MSKKKYRRPAAPTTPPPFPSDASSKSDKQFQNKPTYATTGNVDEQQMPLAEKNYILILVGCVVIILGFVLMSGGGSSSPNEFNYEMFSFRRITLAPIVVVLGFVIEIYAILKRF